ncbi:guanylate kinase [Legionella yabuuchiae]|uniref:guanylate kinase n=1 Tax=Legionella yabuuchiae TaxID=376727 RepID=UPI00105499C7|nr:guanylate kinase [Legionella yabuuchiae]
MAEDYLGSLFIVAAPSGGGKTSLVKKLVEELEKIEVSISHTTRLQRPGETHGVDYFFIDQSTFNQMIEEQAFIEHAHVFEHSYGTSKTQIQDRLRAGIDVVLDIDWQGAKQIKSQYKDAVGIFIIPPSLDALKQRLFNRKQDKQTVIDARMNKAKDELSHYDEFDYLIVNDEFKNAANELKSIVIAHRLRIERQSIQQRKLLSLLLTSQ